MKELILLMLLAQTPHHLDDEVWEEREARMEVVAEAIHDASMRATCQGDYAPPEDDQSACIRRWPGSAKTLSLAMVTMAIFESHLAEHVHKNECRLENGECDARRRYDFREKKVVFIQQAFSPWQLQRFGDIPPAEWKQIEGGVSGTRVAAWHATRRFASAFRACGTMSGAFGRYGRGNGCAPTKSTPKRVALVGKLQKVTRGELASAARVHEERAKANAPEEPPEEGSDEVVVARAD